MTEVVRTVCPYCGVGCGVQATVADHGEVVVAGDPGHPANRGRLCSKGAALGETLDLEGRLLHPEIHGQRVDWPTALDAVADGLARIARTHGPDALAFYVSGQLLTEDYYVANKLMKGFIGSANIDTNSRLCMSSAVAAHQRAFGEDLVPCAYEDLERAKLIVLVGSNTAWCHPVVFQRVVQAKTQNRDLMVVVIDPRRTATCEIADLHLPLRPGTDAILFNGLLVYLQHSGEANPFFLGRCAEGVDAALAAAAESAPTAAAVARACGLEEAAVTEFYRLFARTERVVTAFSQGVNQSSSGTDKGNAIINCHLLTGRIGRPGMGPFSLTGQPNAMGGREVGGLANQLAVHLRLEDARHRDLVRRFWRAPVIAQRPGLKAVELFKAVAAGRVRAVWIMATNPVVSLPDADAVRAALRDCELVVVSDCMRHNDTTALADILLPALAWGEKEGTVTNSERCISRQRAFLPLPGEARPDWWIISQVARRMGHGEAFDYASPAQIFREHAALSACGNAGERGFDISALAALDDEAYRDLAPVQWPVTASRPGGTARLFGDGRFFTPSGRARLIPVVPRPPAARTDEEFPWVLNTGRVRDQWHTMTRTGKAPRLAEHSPEPYVEVHPADARAMGVADGGLTRIISRHGEALVRVRLSVDQQRGSVFMPMHWNDCFASRARVDALVAMAVDPVSGQPEFKHTPVRLVPYRPAWNGFLLSRRKMAIKGVSYWAMARGVQVYRYELAGEQVPEDWPAWARGLLCSRDEEVNWVEYLDAATHRYRGIRLVGDRVESCVFIAPGPDPGPELPARHWLAGLFSKAGLDAQERAGLLAGRPPAGEVDQGRIVCACFGIGEQPLRRAIEEEGLDSVAALGERFKAGTGCGSCIPELRALIAARPLRH